MSVNHIYPGIIEPTFNRVKVAQSTPVDSNELATKSYVDSQSGGGSSSLSYSSTSDSNGISQLDGVYVDSNGKLATGSSSTDSESKIIGIANSAISGDASGSIITFGLISGLSGLTQGSYYYLQSDGTISVTPPSSGYVVEIGQALKTTELFINIQRRVKLA